jgi:membrane protein
VDRTGRRIEARGAFCAAVDQRCTVPGNLAGTINPIIDQAISQRGTVGLVGLLAALYSGIGWMSNLREALSEQCARSRRPRRGPSGCWRTCCPCSGWVSLVGSLAITGLASGSAESLLEAVRLAEQGCPVPARASSGCCSG